MSVYVSDGVRKMSSDGVKSDDEDWEG